MVSNDITAMCDSVTLVSAGYLQDIQQEGVNPWCYVRACVIGYYTGNPPNFYTAAYNSWAYACGPPVCSKVAADTLDNG